MSRVVPPQRMVGRGTGQAATPTVLPHHLGTRLKGRYELIQVIGRGGMSTVYHAVDHIRLRGRAAQPHVADIRLAGHIGQGHLVAQFSALQILVENERKLISRAEARSARHGTNDGRSRVFQEFLIGRPGLFGVVHGANRLRVALRACTGYFIE